MCVVLLRLAPMLEMELNLELDSVYDLSGGQASAVVHVLPLLWLPPAIAVQCQHCSS